MIGSWNARIQQPCFDCFGVGTAVGGVAQATGSVVAANAQAGATRDAATISAGAATHAADVQSASAAATLEFERQQAQAEAAAQETNRKANYNQWAAHEGDVGTIGQLLGLGGKTIPAYVPGVVPSFAAPPAAAAAPGAPGAPAPVVNNPYVTSRLPPGGVLAPAAPSVPSVGQVLGVGGAPGAVAPSGPMANNGAGIPVLQPDGTYRLPSPVMSVGDYLGA